MSQSQLASWVEAVANVLVGFGINYVANLIVLPWFGYGVSASTAFHIGLIFTIISLVRSYVMRRAFNWIQWGRRRG